MASNSLTTGEIAPRYDASIVEKKWYAAWEKAGLFGAQPDTAKPVYTITIPPPNITGSLHMGHALCYSLQDLLGRFHRMRGLNVVIVPGQDHAGIATQVVVSKQLRSQGINPIELGREGFEAKVWEWRKESGDTILKQLRDLGCAFDWSRERFTLDPAYHDAVLRVFIDWFERGIIYRGKRVVNWDPVLQTSVSDIETERRTIKGKLYHIRYPFADGSGTVTIATTRPETMLADVAVAVHPSDERYKGLVGKMLILPLMNREIPLIADIYPDPEFGTGAVKITPAHDPNDYNVGMRHGLDMPVVLDGKARVNENGGAYSGLDRHEARKRIISDLDEQGLLERIDDHELSVLVSQRSGEVIEPLLSEEWFAEQSDLARSAVEAVQEGRVKFVPERYEKVFLDWMDNLHDWNISRRLWWGHRIPVYYDEDGKPHAAMSWDEAQKKSGDRKIVRQDEDVLDTWFSSGLWPFTVLGWPEKSTELEQRYPTNVLVTSRDIIYLWVARMIMFGLDQIGIEPFRDVYIYATVLTESGQRMSKSLGTGVDPAHIIDTFGADALRFALLSQTGFNQEIRYDQKRAEDARNFCNKIWNAARFTLMHVHEDMDRPASLEIMDQWLLSRLAATEQIVRLAYEQYDMQTAALSLHQFFWSELCDWYIEVSKGRLSDASGKEAVPWVLLRAFEAFLKMLHPIMPHLTEEVYQHFPFASRSQFLMTSDWPVVPEEYRIPTAETRVEEWFEITRALRALRHELGITPMSVIPEAHYDGDLAGGEAVITSQAWVTALRPGKPSGRAISAHCKNVDLYLELSADFDLEAFLTRLHRDEEKAASDLAKLEAKFGNPMFMERAKPEVVEKDRALAEELRLKVEKIRATKLSFGS